jgi:hypothetical protein
MTRNTGEQRPSREGIETFLLALGFFLAALVWLWISLIRG